MKMKSFAAALAVLMAGPAMAAACTGTANWGSMGPPGSHDLGNSFSSAGNYLDCYTFSLSSAADSFGWIVEVDPLLNKLDIDVTSVKLFSGAVLGGQTSGALIGSDYTVGAFSFGSLSAGTYTLAVASSVNRDFGFYRDPVGYSGKIATAAISVASPAPEPATYAMMLAGLLGVGAVVRRRREG